MRVRLTGMAAFAAAGLVLAACAIPGATTPGSGTGTTGGTGTGTTSGQTGSYTPGSVQYPVGNLTGAVANAFLSPNAVAGANIWNCTPTAAHPYPVVLVPGTTANIGDNFAMIAPTLANDGYCVYSLNYGQTAASLGLFDGLGDIADSAEQLATFVTKVLSATGASKVDIVGHSQGGMMPNYFIKFLGGAAETNMLVGLAPSNHGTTLDGLTALGTEMGILGFVNTTMSVTQVEGLAEQEEGSAFETNLFAGGDTVPGPQYVVIETEHDEVVTPYTNAFLGGPDVTNITVQDQCPKDPVGHIGMAYDDVVMQDVVNALGADSASFQPTCTGYGLPL